MITPDGEIFDTEINVIEVRACKNGFVVSTWFDSPAFDGRPGRGYETTVVASHDPEAVGAEVTRILKEKQMQLGVFIPAARKLP